MVTRLFKSEDLHVCTGQLAREAEIPCAPVPIMGGFRTPDMVVEPVREQPQIVPAFWAFAGSADVLGEETLLGYQPALFFTPAGEALDFRTSPPTLRNIKLAK